MENAQMKTGFTLIEVMVSLCLLMICIVSFAKLYHVCIHAKTHGEYLTRATILGSTKLHALRVQPLTTTDLLQGWHEDRNNPITDNGMDFFRFWTVVEKPDGMDVTMFVIWGDKKGPEVRSFSSGEELKKSACPHIDLHEFFVNLNKNHG